MSRFPTTILVLTLIMAVAPTTSPAADKKHEAQKLPAGCKFLTKFIELAKAGKIDEAVKLSTSNRRISPDLYRRHIRDLGEIASRKGVAIQEYWAGPAHAVAVFPAQKMNVIGADKRRVLAIVAQKKNQAWLVSSVAIYRPNRWNEVVKLVERRFKAKRIGQVKPTKK